MAASNFDDCFQDYLLDATRLIRRILNECLGMRMKYDNLIIFQVYFDDELTLMPRTILIMQFSLLMLRLGIQSFSQSNKFSKDIRHSKIFNII